MIENCVHNFSPVKLPLPLSRRKSMSRNTRLVILKPNYSVSNQSTMSEP